MSLEARLAWRSSFATHIDRLIVNENALQADGRWLAAGENLRESAEVNLDPAPWCQPSGQAVIALTPDSVQRQVELVPGRFYPRAVFGTLAGNPRDKRPVRLLAACAEKCANSDSFYLDPNHPLATADVRLSLRPAALPAASGVRLVELFEGPGMQCPPADAKTALTYFTASGFERQDQGSDAAFYATPRLIQHLDAQCRSAIADLYGRFLHPGQRVLDLMASTDSHLPALAGDLQVAGLGMNSEELAANERLSEQVVQDLNGGAALPWPDKHFDCVFNTAAIEYLTQPSQVMSEVRRVLRPGGIFALTFSDRWFPSKAIRLWSQIHPFERLGLVLSLLQQAGFSDLHTETLRGVRRPEKDRYATQRAFSDPLFAVWGRRS